MDHFHNALEWKLQLETLNQKLTPGESIPYEIFQEFLRFFNTPIHTWKIPFKQSVNEENKEEEKTSTAQVTSLTEQITLEQTKQYLWSNFYKRLTLMEYEKGEVFHIQHTSLAYPGFTEKEIDEYPPHTIIYEAVAMEDVKFLRIWNVSMPTTEALIYGDGESFHQYFEYAKCHIPKIQELIQEEEDLYQVIVAERKRHGNEPYATVAGQRDIEKGNILFFYWAEHFFFSAELFLDEESVCPHMCYNPILYPYPVQYFRAKNFRKFRYLEEV